MEEAGQTTNESDHGPKHPDRDGEFHLILSDQDRELLDELARRTGVSRAEMIRRALHLAKSIQDMHRWVGGDPKSTSGRGGDANLDHS